MHTYKVVASLVLFAAQLVHADTIYLSDGSKREGTILEQNDSVLKLSMKHGPLNATVEIKTKEIIRIETKPVAETEDQIQYQLLQKEAARLEALDHRQGAFAWLRFAQFCDGRNGYDSYAQKAYLKAMELEPNLLEARTALGYEWKDEQWVKTNAPKPEPLVVAARYVPPPTPDVPYASPYADTTYSTPAPQSSQLSDRPNYSSQTYYGDGYGNYSDGSSNYTRQNAVVVLSSVNGQLVPTAISSGGTYYNGSSGYSTYRNRSSYYGGNPSSSSYGTSSSSYTGTYGGTYSTGISGNVGYYSDGYYRSSGYGGTTHVSGRLGNSGSFSGTISGGGCSTGSSSYGMSGPSYGFRYGFR